MVFRMNGNTDDFILQHAEAALIPDNVSGKPPVNANKQVFQWRLL